MMAMSKLKPSKLSIEIRCAACDGTGYPAVAQPKQPGRRIYPPPCKRCSGKGRIDSA
jgi:DnaJ-class molecular chaperone